MKPNLMLPETFAAGGWFTGAAMLLFAIAAWRMLPSRIAAQTA